MLGPYHQLYHGSTRLFKKTFLPYLIVVTILFVVGQIGTFMALSSFSIGSMMLTLISSVLLVAASVWALVLLIFNGRTYNRKLYEQVQGRAEDIPTRLKPALILLVGYAAAMILVSALISVIGGKMVSNAWMENLPSDYDAAQADSSRFTESSDDRTGDSNGNEAGSGSPWLLAEDENFWDGAWENTTTGDVTTFAGFAIGTFYFEDGHIDENGNYVVYLMAPGGNGDEMQAQLLVSSDGTSLIYYIASNAGGLIASDEFKRPTAARNDSLPSELWGNYIYDSGPERNGTLTVDAFRIDDNTYFNARQENGVWVVETGNGIEGWNERLSLLPDGRLSIQDDYSTEPTYYVRVSASGQSAEKEPVPDNPSLDLSRLPQIPSEDTDLFSVCFWTDAYNSQFLTVLRNTLIINFLKIVWVFPIPIMAAIMLNEIRHKVYRKLCQTAIYVPYFFSWVVIYGIFYSLLGTNGIVNSLLSFLGFEKIGFFTDTSVFRSLLVFTEGWKTVGYNTIIFLAAITSIDVGLYEAARVDGANKWQQIWNITLPGMLPTIVMMLILRVGHILDNSFEQILVFYNSIVYEVADVIQTFVYRIGIGQMNFSLSAAMGLFNSIVAFILIVGANAVSKKLLHRSIW